MEVILLEKVGRFGKMGDVVKVKDGYARNFLIPRKKALRATKSNLDVFAQQKAELEALNAQKRATAEALLEKMVDVTVSLERQAGEDGRLYGSVSANDIAKLVSAKSGIAVEADSIVLNSKIKEIGMYQIEVMLHPEVKATVNLSIARSEAEHAHNA
jgi:large subunit ribosomal protein L9